MVTTIEKPVNRSDDPNRACGVLDAHDADTGLRDRLKRELSSTALQS